MSRDFVGALLQLNAEKQVSREQLIGAVEDGIQSAYRRVAGDEDIHVRIDAESGKIRVFRARLVVEEIEDELTQITVDDAQAFDANAKPGDLVETEQLDGDVFGRIGAQTAKQIVLQRIREVERDQVFDQFASREGELITGTVNRVEPRAIILDVGKNAEAILATTEQSAARALPDRPERQGVRARGPPLVRGPQIFVSRTHKGFLRRLFELEVPEIHSGTVEIKAIAREAGSRSKVAVASRQEGLDPVGATVGQRGARVQAVVAELAGEKIDVIPWNDDPAVFVANALSPAQVLSVDIDEEHRIASVTVPERMLSLAIGREGQNARLAARLTGWRIDIRSDVSVAEAKAAAEQPEAGAASDRRRGGRGAESTAPGRGEATPSGTAAPAKPKRTTKKAAAADGYAAAATDAAAAPAATMPAPQRDGAAAAGQAEASRHEGGGQGDRRPRRTRHRRHGRRRERHANRHTRRGGGVVAAASTPAAAPARRVPTRTCVACRTSRPNASCERIVRTPAARSCSTRRDALAGRGAYVCHDTDCLTIAITKGALSRALETQLPAAFLASAGREPSPTNTDRRRSPWPGVGAAPAAGAGPASHRVATAHSRVAGPGRSIRASAARSSCPATITVKELAELLVGQRRGRHPRADQERHLRDDQPADRPRHRVAGRLGARLRGRRGGRRVDQRDRTPRRRVTARRRRRPRKSSSRRTIPRSWCRAPRS